MRFHGVYIAVNVAGRSAVQVTRSRALAPTSTRSAHITNVADAITIIIGINMTIAMTIFVTIFVAISMVESVTMAVLGDSEVIRVKRQSRGSSHLQTVYRTPIITDVIRLTLGCHYGA